MKRSVEYAVSEVDEFGDAGGVMDHFDGRQGKRLAIACADKMVEAGSLAVIVDRKVWLLDKWGDAHIVDPADADMAPIYTAGDKKALEAGGWIDTTEGE